MSRLQKFLGFTDPVGKVLKWENQPFTIIAVVKDIMQSLLLPGAPTLYHVGTYDNMYNMIMRLNPERNAASSLKQLNRN